MLETMRQPGTYALVAISLAVFNAKRKELFAPMATEDDGLYEFLPDAALHGQANVPYDTVWIKVKASEQELPADLADCMVTAILVQVEGHRLEAVAFGKPIVADTSAMMNHMHPKMLSLAVATLTPLVAPTEHPLVTRLRTLGDEMSAGQMYVSVNDGGRSIGEYDLNDEHQVRYVQNLLNQYQRGHRIFWQYGPNMATVQVGVDPLVVAVQPGRYVDEFGDEGMFLAFGPSK